MSPPPPTGIVPLSYGTKKTLRYYDLLCNYLGVFF